LVARTIASVQIVARQGRAIAASQFKGLASLTLPPTLPGGPKRRTVRGLGACLTTCSNNRAVCRESPCHQFVRWHGALRRHFGSGIGDADGQSRRRGERSHPGPKRALRVQSVSMLVAAELLLPPAGLLRLWTKLLQLCTKLLCAKLLRLRRLARRL